MAGSRLRGSALPNGCGLALLLLSAVLGAQQVPPEKADDARVNRLLGEMTLEEKVNLIRGATEPAASNRGQAGFLPGVPRLGIPSLRFADGPPGLLTRVPSQAQTATMGVAATWSRRTAEDNGIAIGRDARSRGIDVILQPFVNIDRDIGFTRGFNTFGEDPYLTGQIGAAEIRGAQAQGVMAQAKHYVGYDTDSFNVAIDPQTLHEVYVAPFAAAIAAGVSSVMCSYNRINGEFACGSSSTLEAILKEELGFKGFVTSDWGAVHDVRFINHGLDMEMPGDLGSDSPLSAFMHTHFRIGPPPPAPAQVPGTAALAGMLGGTIPEERPTALNMAAFPRDADSLTLGRALSDSTVSEATVTAAARRVLHEIDRFGYLDGKQKHAVTAEPIAANAQIIERTAEEAAVLLKNQGGVLPLGKSDLASLAMIGPTAGQVAAIGTFGERSPGLTERQVGPVAAMKKLSPGSKILFAVDDDMTGTPIPASVLSHDGKSGLERRTGTSIRVDPILDFTQRNHAALVPQSRVTWRGDLKIAATGTYWLYLQVLGGRAVLEIDGKELGRTGAVAGAVHGDIQFATQDNGLPTTDGLDNVRRAVPLEAGSHAISVQLAPDGSNAPAQIRLSWMTPDARARTHAEAIAAARGARAAVVFLWTRGQPVFGLPGEQDQLVEEVAAANPNTIVVLNTSQPIAMPWLDRVKGVLEMWWPGDEGGWATARLLLGKTSPSGHLPVTWAKRLEDYPATDPAHPERSAEGVDGKTTFTEGVLVGYRWFDSQHIEPLYPFGFGLSYSTYSITDMSAHHTGDGGASVTLRIRNAGNVAGDAVPQLYLDAPMSKADGIAFAPRTLVGFERVHLDAGEAREVTAQISPRAFQYWSEAGHGWKRPPGPRTIRAGTSSRQLTAAAVLP